MFPLAHQGGWDELLWFAAPIVVVMAWVRHAERTARRRAAGRAGVPSPTLPPHDPDH